MIIKTYEEQLIQTITYTVYIRSSNDINSDAIHAMNNNKSLIIMKI